ncbi:MAG: DHHA1 domain-containing protein [Clostridium sp.]|nr:MAG: DHHA1 domain-containing protein [Clostridium sp.]
MALFGEKYGEMVRVVDMGVSKEFCGGTHVKNTKDISKFAICNFTSIGSGLFRIEGVTSNDASMLEVSYNASLVNDLKALENKAQTIIEAAKPDKLVFNYKENENMPTGYRFVLTMREEIAKALKACKDLEKELNQIKSKNALSDLASYEKMIEGNTLFTSIDGLDTGLAKDLACALQNKYNLDAVMLALTDGEKLSLICATSGKYNAANLVREACKITGGGGGGKPTLAQAGAKDASKVSLAFSHIKEIL